MRPPRTKDGTDVWMTSAPPSCGRRAIKLAKAAAAQDYAQSRAGLAAVANSCNRCHQSFKVAARVNPFTDE